MELSTAKKEKLRELELKRGGEWHLYQKELLLHLYRRSSSV